MDSDSRAGEGKTLKGTATDREGFEPSKGLPPYRFSRQTPRKHSISRRATMLPNPAQVCRFAKGNWADVFPQL
jgi:hypothetical protein